MAAPVAAQGTIPCCLCGAAIVPNQANMCRQCIAPQLDITEGISRQVEIHQCKACGRYENAQGRWQFCELESVELLALCLKAVHGLRKIKVVDSKFIWTEPHSKRLKVNIVVEKEVEKMNNAVFRQALVVEYILRNLQCISCTKLNRKDTWNALVQIRQKVEHKRTFYYLEQEILRREAHAAASGIVPMKDGMDFFFTEKNEAEKFCHFLSSVVPQRIKTSRKMVSQDVKNNTANMKITHFCEIVPVCKGDCVVLPPKLAQQLGQIGPLVLVERLGSSLHVVDPATLKRASITADKYWKNPFKPLATSRMMTEFVILDCEPRDSGRVGTQGESGGEQHVTDAEVVRASDFGVNDTTFRTASHLGGIIKAGDEALGFDFSTTNFNSMELHMLQSISLPDIILVHKRVPKNTLARRARRPKRTLGVEDIGKGKKDTGEGANEEYESFLEAEAAEKLTQMAVDE